MTISVSASPAARAPLERRSHATRLPPGRRRDPFLSPDETLTDERARELGHELGLRGDEYDDIVATLGRVPTVSELGMYSVMWSEHCSYKSSKIHLARLDTTGPDILAGPGENAGVVDVGDGLAVAFKIESHNHPSFVEPYQGAATGVGGILRDIFTMGARPIAVMDALRFGDPTVDGIGPRSTAFQQHIVDGVVRGSVATATASACPTSAARRSSTIATPPTRWSTCWRGRDARRAAPVGRGRTGRATWRSCWVRRRVVTASVVRRCWPARSSTKVWRPNAPTCRWGIRSVRSR